MSKVDGHEEAMPNVTVSVVIPDMNFTCNQMIASFTVSGSNLRRGNQNSMIQIWREKNNSHPGPGVYYKTGPSIPLHTLGDASRKVCEDGIIQIAQGTYLCILINSFRVAVQTGDVLGLELPSTTEVDFEVDFVNGGPMNYVFHRQLINSTIDLSTSDSEVRTLPQISFSFTSGDLIRIIIN